MTGNIVNISVLIICFVVLGFELDGTFEEEDKFSKYISEVVILYWPGSLASFGVDVLLQSPEEGITL